MIIKNYLKALLSVFCIVTLLVGCAPNTEHRSIPTEDTGNDGELVVAATFFPIYDLTRRVVGEEGTVYSIVPSGVEPHSFDPSPGDIRKLADSDAYVTLGVEFEAYEDTLIESLDGKIKVIPAGEGISILEFDEHDDHDGHVEGEHDEHADEDHDEHSEEEHEDHGEHSEDDHSDEDHDDHAEEDHAHDEDDHAEHSDEEGHDEYSEDEHAHDEDDHADHKEEDHDDHHGHDHSGGDPHIWMSPQNAQVLVANIVTGMIQLDSENAEVYKANGDAVIADLAKLHEDFEAGLGSCAKDTVLVNHNAYAYLARDYGFTVISITGLSPESEPTPRQLTQLIDEAREHDLKYVFYEELVDPRVATTIADEVGAEVLELSPVAGSSDSSATYISLMEKNLANLKIAMECS